MLEGIVFIMVTLSALCVFTDRLSEDGETGARLISGLCGVAFLLSVWEEIAGWF